MDENIIKLLKNLLEESVQKCYDNDKTLIDRGMEQASVARIYYYMQNAINTDDRFLDIRDYNLDSEYNKNGKLIKDTPQCENGTRPDIILHKRYTGDGNQHNKNDNLLVLEFKSFRKQEFDILDKKTKIKIEKNWKILQIRNWRLDQRKSMTTFLGYL
jgi:hypothetical protein